MSLWMLESRFARSRAEERRSRCRVSSERSVERRVRCRERLEDLRAEVVSGGEESRRRVNWLIRASR